ncbi:YdbH domain-containing protein [Marinobacter sp.]|uniref:intermembrane phospholipid transport protein YdbH family protein n=1 Tax=Marinobacter sp. TaxID=50741 RepID=UPI0034A58BDE
MTSWMLRKRPFCLIALAWLAVASPSVVAAAWSLVLQQGQIGLTLPDVREGLWEVAGNRADVDTAVSVKDGIATVWFRPASQLRSSRVIHTDPVNPVLLKNVRAELNNVTVKIDLYGKGTLPERSSVAGQVMVEVESLEHPRLKTQGWTFEGSLDGALADLTVEGQLRSESGLVASVTARNVAGEFLAVRGSMVVDGEQGGKGMASTFTDWPGLLELTRGQIQAQATVRVEPNTPMSLHSQLDFENVDGVMDRTAVSGLNGRLLVTVDGDDLAAHFRDLHVGQISSGIGFGPIRFLADYNAPLEDPGAGVLDIQQATAGFLDGHLRVAPGAIDPSGPAWQFPVEVYDVSLAALLQVYPAEGIEGTGQLSGRIPVGVSDAGIEVDGGKVSAKAPGGVLRLPAERLQAMLGGSQAMELVLKALQNFHYSVLDSTIDYDEKGKLMLDLTLEGENPEVRGGQPVVLNINLEEDIPALLTSLQLSGRVNEAVTERVRERLEQSGQEAMP